LVQQVGLRGFSWSGTNSVYHTSREIFGVDRSIQRCRSATAAKYEETDAAIIAAQRKARRLRAMNVPASGTLSAPSMNSYI
jgi:hypothetical protein